MLKKTCPIIKILINIIWLLPWPLRQTNKQTNKVVDLPTVYVSLSLKLHSTWSVFLAWRKPLPLTTTWKRSETRNTKGTSSVRDDEPHAHARATVRHIFSACERCISTTLVSNFGLNWFPVSHHGWQTSCLSGVLGFSGRNVFMLHYCLFISGCLCVYVWKGHNMLHWC